MVKQKYRIVELKNGRFAVQSKADDFFSFMFHWATLNTFIELQNATTWLLKRKAIDQEEYMQKFGSEVKRIIHAKDIPL